MGNKNGKSTSNSNSNSPNSRKSTINEDNFVLELFSGRSGCKPLIDERNKEESLVVAVAASNKSVVTEIHYSFNASGYFTETLGGINTAGHKFQIVVVVRNKANLTWRECQAIRDAIRLGERFTQLSKTEFTSWVEKLLPVHKNVQLSEPGRSSSIITITPEVPSKRFKPGFILSSEIKKEYWGDYSVIFETDAEKYQISVKHVVIGTTFAREEAAAFADAINIGEPGDKMDDSIFLQWMARLREKYSCVLINRSSQNVLVACIMPTKVPIARLSSILTLKSMILPAANGDPLDWSDETKERQKYGHNGVNCDGCPRSNFTGRRYKCKVCDDFDLCQSCYDKHVCTKSHRSHHAVQVIEPKVSVDVSDVLLQALLAAVDSDGMSPLKKERLHEELVVNESTKEKKAVVVKTSYKFDNDGDFAVCLAAGDKESFRYLIYVRLKDKSNISFTEARGIRDALKLGVRGNEISLDVFGNKWKDILERSGNYESVSLKKTDIAWALVINPKAVNARNNPGRVTNFGISIDKDSDFVINFSTDIQEYTIVINHTLHEESFAIMEIYCLADSVYLTEPGDKMDPGIFMQVCARLRQKYHLLQYITNNNKSIAYIVPTRLDQDVVRNERFENKGELPTVHQNALEWSETTKRRLAAVASPDTASPATPEKKESAANGEKSGSDELAEMLLRLLAEAAGGGDVNLPSYGEGGKVKAKRLLKKSGQAVVYEGTKAANDGKLVPVAIKVYHQELDWEDCREELMALIRIPAHANVINVLDFYERPKPCVVMPLISGSDLRDYLDKTKEPLPQIQATSVLCGIANGLLHLHSSRIVHRDLKSANVLLEIPSFRPVLIDFGLGKSTDQSITQMKTANIKGTVFWMAPEMMTDQLWSTKTDIFALGIIMWEIYSGRMPYFEKPFTSIPPFINYIINENGRPDVSAVRNRAGMTSDRCQLMKDCWGTDVKRRPTAEEFLVKFGG